MQESISKAHVCLRSATVLAQERDHDSAISRTYLAMYHAVQAMLLSRNKAASSHAALISAFCSEFVRTGIFPPEMGKSLIRAFLKRRLAEYEGRSLLTEKDSEDILQEGSSFVHEIDRHLRAGDLLD